MQINNSIGKHYKLVLFLELIYNILHNIHFGYHYVEVQLFQKQFLI